MSDGIVLKISPSIRFLDKLSIGILTFNFVRVFRFCIKVKVDPTLIPYSIIYIRSESNNICLLKNEFQKI